MTESVRDAARTYWVKRRRNSEAGNYPGSAGRANAYVSVGSARSGEQLIEALADALTERSVDRDWIQIGRDAMLPGAYGVGRSAWDLVAVRDEVPLAAVAFKAMGGTGMGKNINNRVQELTSIAFDVRRQYYGQELSRIRPYLGLFFILEESELMHKPVNRSAEAYRTLGDWETYEERLGATFKQFRSDGLYDGIAYCTSSIGDNPSLEEPYAQLSIDGFINSLAERVLSLAETQRTSGITAAVFREMLARRPDIQEVMTTLAPTEATGGPSGETSAEQARGAEETIQSEPEGASVEDFSLLFRAYVPADRLYATELGAFLSLFRGWVSGVRGRTIRQGGYETAAGRVYEFYLVGDARIDLAQERADFSSFLALCESDSSAAADRLVQDGMGRPQASAFADRCAKQVRRLNLDLKQERERRLLAISHDIESSLVDSGGHSEAVADQVRSVLEVLVPDISASTYGNILGAGQGLSRAGGGITINQQFIGKVEGIVNTSINGESSLASQAKELLALIDAYGGESASSLRSAVFEVEDKEAPSAKRRDAKKTLKGFLRQVGTLVYGVGVDVLEKYLESRVGA